MNNKMDPNKKVEDTLNSLDELVKAEASPFLFSALLSQIQEEKKWWTIFANILSKPAVAISLILVVILLNTWLLWSGPSTGNDNSADPLNDLAIAYDFEQNNLPEQTLQMP
jgi:hypothetical protein